MKAAIRYFALLRETLGEGETMDLVEGDTVGTVRDRLLARGEPYASVLARGRAVRCALNRTICDEAPRVEDGDELAFFPPVTGG